MKLIIAGSRGFDDPTLMKIKLRTFLNMQGFVVPDEVISGGAKGADHLGAQWALQRDITLTYYHPNWNKYGKSAGYRRNETMADAAGYLVAFHDGESKGTQHMIDIARRKGLVVEVISYNGEPTDE